MPAPTNTNNNMMAARYVLIAILIAAAFFVSYRVAAAWNRPDRTEAPVAGAPAQAGGVGSAQKDGGGGCCTGSASSAPIEGQTTLADGVQRISVDVSRGYDPSVIRTKANIPLEVSFSAGSGCMAEVGSRDLGFFEDLTTGPKTVKIPALAAGEYGFSCGMGMVFGSIIVE